MYGNQINACIVVNNCNYNIIFLVIIDQYTCRGCIKKVVKDVQKKLVKIHREAIKIAMKNM